MDGRGKLVRPIELSPRLCTVAGLVPHKMRFADIGTDHAYLPIWLLQRGLISYAVVSDLRQGPLERAKRNARRYGLMESMSFRLGDGLTPIVPDEVEVIAIAGMGGESMVEILAAAPWTKQGNYQLILQPMSALDELRSWLQPNGYRIEKELLCEDDRLYTVLSVVPGEMSPLTPAECWAGRQTCDPLRGVMLEKLILRAERALEGLQRSTRPSDLPHRAMLEQVLQGLIKMKEEWDSWQP